MKTFALPALLACSMIMSACSRSDDSAPGAATPRPNLRADAERLQQAINKAAEQRKQQSPSPAASP